MSEQDVKLESITVDGKTATHYCNKCGALWRLLSAEELPALGGGWTLVSKTCGRCCDNEVMGAQIVALTLSPRAVEGAREAVACGEYLIVRHDAPDYAEYLRCRFYAQSYSGPFLWAGHRWRYEHTSFDDAGQFDVLWRPSPPPAAPSEGEDRALFNVWHEREYGQSVPNVKYGTRYGLRWEGWLAGRAQLRGGGQ